MTFMVKKRGQLVIVRLDCPKCALELEVICRVTGRWKRWQYDDSREAETVSVNCEGGCELSPEQLDDVKVEAEAIASDLFG